MKNQSRMIIAYDCDDAEQKKEQNGRANWRRLISTCDGLRYSIRVLLL